nr:hypothetical protein Iba_scaffold7214CG0030 [Ipomoea batatas]GME21462.1 hypothetical protein Iba_scaffold27907CG0060 [Ipomoea batatas]
MVQKKGGENNLYKDPSFALNLLSPSPSLSPAFAISSFFAFRRNLVFEDEIGFKELCHSLKAHLAAN